MNINSFNFKLLSIVVGAFLIMTALVTILADTQIKNILDKNQEAIYVDRVETIIGILGRSNKNLQKTGLVEVYADDFRKTALLTLRDNYYDRGVESVYPFILHKDGKVVMHPNLVKGDDSLQDKELYKKIIAQKNKSGTSIAQSFEVQGAWYVVSEFDEWDWIVGYTVPLDLKYLEARIFRNTFITFMVGITLSMVIIIIYIVTRFTRPIIYLTEASKQIADGTLDQTINLTGKDEIGILATSFNNMRLAIKSKIAELNHEIKERKSIELSLKESKVQLKNSERMLQLVMDTIPQYIFWKDRDSVYLGCNKNFAKRAGLDDPADIKGMNEHELPWTKEEADSFIEWDQKIMENNAPEFHFIESQLMANGENSWVDISKIPLYDDNDTVVGIMGMFEDITQQRLAEEALKQNYEQLKAIYNTLPVILWSLDENGVFVLSEGQELKTVGFSPGEVVGISALELYKENTFIVNNIQKSLKGEFCEYESEFSGVIYHTFLTPFFDESGDVRGVNGLAINVTEKREVEAELHSLRNYLENIIDSMPSLIVGVDSNNCVTQWNKTVEKKTGIIAREARGKKLSDVLPQMSQEMRKITLSIKTGQVIHNQQIVTNRSEGIGYENITIYPLVAKGDEGAVIRIDDVTDKVRLEEMMIQNEKMLSVGGLAAGMAHEINNPLAGMMQTASVMKNRLENLDLPANLETANEIGVSLKMIHNYMRKRDIFRMIDSINESGVRVADIVANMLSFARKTDSMMVQHDPIKLMEQTLELASTDYDLKKQYDFKTIKIIREFEDDLPLLQCEGSKIQQVLLNIFRNGVQAMQVTNAREREEACFKVSISLEKQSNMMRFEIKDNGPGIEKEIQKRVFEPFFTTKPPGVGTGLGLSVSYFIIKSNHGGTLDVESEVGEGTTFIIRLPLELQADLDENIRVGK